MAKPLLHFFNSSEFLVFFHLDVTKKQLNAFLLSETFLGKKRKQQITIPDIEGLSEPDADSDHELKGGPLKEATLMLPSEVDSLVKA